MFTFNHLRRRLTLSHAHGHLHARIAPQDKTKGRLVLIPYAALLLFVVGSTFLPPCFHRRGSSSLACLLIFLIPLIAVGFSTFYASIWIVFGVEEVTVQGGTLRWTRTALFWKRKFETMTADISSVKAITPWHSLSNRVEFTAGDRVHSIGDRLLRDEAIELASALNHTLHLH